MTLHDIFLQTSQIFKAAPNTEPDRQFLLFWINLAAQEFWTSQDLRDSINENTYTIGSDKIIALPPEIGEVRAIRDCCDKATIVSRIARYQTGSWANDRCWQFTILGLNPLMQAPPDTLATLRLNFLGANNCRVDITITGHTTNAARKTYTVTFEPGETEKTLNTTLLGIDSIVKSRTSDTDFSLIAFTEDNEEVEISTIRNIDIAARFLLLQVGTRLCSCEDKCNTPFEGQDFDILYKLPFTPLVNDTDIFPIDGFEPQFFYKLIEIKKLSNLPEGSIDVFSILSSKQKNLKDATNNNQNTGVTQKVDWGRNPFAYMGRGYYPRWNGDCC